MIELCKSRLRDFEASNRIKNLASNFNFLQIATWGDLLYRRVC